ncbi:MAG: hypothetical protein QNJ92_16255, partial [Alphaproteobacteria bacterium]|nr:hypothetical protein [Alphaproteobacteria bacterium]
MFFPESPPLGGQPGMRGFVLQVGQEQIRVVDQGLTGGDVGQLGPEGLAAPLSVIRGDHAGLDPLTDRGLGRVGQQPPEQRV